MSDFPSLPWEYNQDEEDDQAIDERRATNRDIHTRILGPVRYLVRLSNPHLTRTQYDTLMAHYHAHRGVEFAYQRTRAGVVENYMAKYLGQVKYRYVDGMRFDVKLMLRVRAA